MALQDTDGPLPKFAAREQVPLLDEPNMTALFILDRLSIQLSHATPTFSDFLDRQRRYYAPRTSHHKNVVGSFTREATTTRILQKVLSNPKSSIAINPWLHLLPASPS